MTSRRERACIRYCMTPAKNRRPATPNAFSSATPRMSSAPVTSVPVATSPLANAGNTTCSVAQPSAHADPTVMTP